MNSRLLTIVTTLLLVIGFARAEAQLIGFEDLTAGSASFNDLGIDQTYFGYTWTADNSNQQPTLWGAAEGVLGDVSAFEGTGFAWTFNGGQSMFVDFFGPKHVQGVYLAGQFPGNSSSSVQMFGYDQSNNLVATKHLYRGRGVSRELSSVQMFGYDQSNNLVATSAPLDLVDGQWQFLSGGELTIIGVHRLELRSNAPTTWFAIDNLEISEVPEPSSVLLFAAFGVAAGVRRRR